MTTPEALNALADRVEREEPHALLDAAIHAVVHGAMDLQDDLPRYTTSLDAAVTLVPEWYRWSMSQGDRFAASVHDRTALFLKDRRESVGSSHLPALALCAAALRARASLTEKG